MYFKKEIGSGARPTFSAAGGPGKEKAGRNRVKKRPDVKYLPQVVKSISGSGPGGLTL